MCCYVQVKVIKRSLSGLCILETKLKLYIVRAGIRNIAQGKTDTTLGVKYIYFLNYFYRVNKVCSEDHNV